MPFSCTLKNLSRFESWSIILKRDGKPFRVSMSAGATVSVEGVDTLESSQLQALVRRQSVQVLDVEEDKGGSKPASVKSRTKKPS